MTESKRSTEKRWKVCMAYSDRELEDKLNELAVAGWEIFQVDTTSDELEGSWPITIIAKLPN